MTLTCTRCRSQSTTGKRLTVGMSRSKLPSRILSRSGTIPDYYLGFKLDEDGQFEEIFNGPGKLIYEHFRNRKDLGTKLLSLPTAKLRELSRTVQRSDRIPRREEV